MANIVYEKKVDIYLEIRIKVYSTRTLKRQPGCKNMFQFPCIYAFISMFI